ncbi:glycoside hydrolase family 53 protein [Paenibacillus sp. 8b26]|uniref:glycoside hydrolase family 53 protein n=1 Tax=Paenibacillus sp. 8b26 TaxID=3424133 RepID=UPI003D64FD94
MIKFIGGTRKIVIMLLLVIVLCVNSSNISQAESPQVTVPDGSIESSLSPNENLVPVGATIANYDFEIAQDSKLKTWQVSGDKSSSQQATSGYSGQHSLQHANSRKDYQVRTEQILTGLENGYYTLTGWTKNSGGQRAAYLYAKGADKSESRTALPVSSQWIKVTVRGVQVNDGKMTVGIYSDAKAGNWLNLDFVELVHDNRPYKLPKGGDVSELTQIEAKGGKFYDRKGKQKDLFQILKEEGHDIVRLRLYNDPGKGKGDGEYYRPAGFMDKQDILKLAKRAKAAGLQIQLSFHYSDYWTNGELQIIPNEWQKQIQNLTTEQQKVDKLYQLLYDYTTEIMQSMKAQGTTPEYVSLGNEMQSGLLYPFGKIEDATSENWDHNWDHLARFLKAGSQAVKAVSPSTKVIIHLDDAGNYNKYYDFFDQLNLYQVDYDIIGPSYYPYWTKKTVSQLVDFLNDIGQKYEKDIMIMETGFNWNPTLPDNSPGQLVDNGPYPASMSSREGQRDFMYELFNGLKSVNNGRVIGDLYWDPIMIPAPGLGWAIREADDLPGKNVVSNTTLFDFDGKALPVFDAYRYNTEGVPSTTKQENEQ